MKTKKFVVDSDLLFPTYFIYGPGLHRDHPPALGLILRLPKYIRDIICILSLVSKN